MKSILSWFKSVGIGLLIGTQVFPCKTLAQETGVPSSRVRSPDNYICSQNLPTAINAIVTRPALVRSRFGIEIQTQDQGSSLYSLNAEQYFTPASSVKLLTTAAALLELGADYRIVTPVYGVGKTPNLIALRIKGQGDPTVSTQSLKDIVHQLQDQGIERIEKLIVDDSYFSAPSINPTWEWLDVYSYFATSVNSLILNQNTVTLTLSPQKLGEPVKFNWSDAIAARQWQVVNQGITSPENTPYDVEIDGVLGKPILNIYDKLAINEPPDIWDLAVADPANYFLESWRLELTNANIAVVKGIVVSKPDNYKLETKLATITSPSLQTILTEINQESNNLYAETVGAILSKELNTDSAANAIEQSLTKLGINPQNYVLVDSSGLSRHNLITPKTLVQTLSLMSRSSQGKLYRNSLAVTGVNGTLKARFEGTSIQGNLWGKTGTLTGIGTLSGYLVMPEYDSLVFTILVNNSALSSQEIRQTIDEITMLLGRLKKC